MKNEEIGRLWHELRQKIAKHIEQREQCIQAVTDDPSGEPFMYTIGNFHRGLPELLIVGTADDRFVGVLNRLGKIQRDRGHAFADEELVSVGGKFPLRIVDAREIGRRKYATFVGIFYNTEIYQVRQVLLPDTAGRWPDTPGCDLPYRNQPILSAIGRVRH